MLRLFSIGFVLQLILLIACASVPITGRSQLNIIPEAEMLNMSYSQYSTFLSEHKLISTGPQAAMVKRVGQRIQAAVEAYFAAKGLSSELANYRWQFELVDDDQVNAWCMPGGKVVVYTGILPITADETGLAVVMGHEIAHAIANHGSERMSHALLQQMGGMALATALEKQPEETRSMWMSAYGIGSNVAVMLPYSRSHESEADHLGIIFMAMAGYDPAAAIDFWQRMAAGKGETPPELLSTHPSDATRINDIRKHLPEAQKYYNKQ
jgi:predicted Zn-dependent protease